jgi:hypothetical protein
MVSIFAELHLPEGIIVTSLPAIRAAKAKLWCTLSEIAKRFTSFVLLQGEVVIFLYK